LGKEWFAETRRKCLNQIGTLYKLERCFFKLNYNQITEKANKLMDNAKLEWDIIIEEDDHNEEFNTLGTLIVMYWLENKSKR
jgi:hypothetical protein